MASGNCGKEGGGHPYFLRGEEMMNPEQGLIAWRIRVFKKEDGSQHRSWPAVSSWWHWPEQHPFTNGYLPILNTRTPYHAMLHMILAFGLGLVHEDICNPD